MGGIVRRALSVLARRRHRDAVRRLDGGLWPGWYPDLATGGERWFDGERWTEQRRHRSPS